MEATSSTLNRGCERREGLTCLVYKPMMLPTNKATLEALQRIAEALEGLGVQSEDLKTLKRHIGQQGRQIGWEYRRGKWVYGRNYNYPGND